MPYVYARKGVKKSLICSCVGWEDETMDVIVGFERRMERPEDWVRFCRGAINENDGEITDETLLSWYGDYKREWNKKWSKDKIKQHRNRKSKYAEMFKGKTKEEISDMIDKMDISRGRKSQLRKDQGIRNV